MTRKDYQLLAATFRQALDNNGDAPGIEDFRAHARAGITHTLILLCDNLAKENPRFDRRKFLFAATGSHDLHLAMLEVDD